MALVSHTIYSKYDPPEEDGATTLTESASVPEETLWQIPVTRNGSGPSRLPPRFVTAQIPTDEYGRRLPLDADPSEAKLVEGEETRGGAVSGWYRNLVRTIPEPEIQIIPNPNPNPRSKPVPQPTALSIAKFKEEPVNSGDWFSRKPSRFKPEESIASRLIRDPPPDRGSTKSAPPAWIALGPWNKGYEMLSNRGWKEGEGLGPRPGIGLEAGRERRPPKSSEISDNQSEGGDEIIDLTLSSDEGSEIPAHSPSPSPPPPPSRSELALSSGGTQLLTPLPTILKSDRLGIGLNPVYTIHTSSGLRIPRKRVTHSDQALRVHAQSAEEGKRMRQKWGRGANGQKRKQKAEAESRRRLIAYLNE